MTLFEMLGLLGAFVFAVIGLVIGLSAGLGWWTIAIVLVGLVVGWLSGVGVAMSGLLDRQPPK